MRSLVHVATAPLWPLQLATAAKSFEHNPLIGSRQLNRWGLHAKRVELAARLAAARRARLASRVSGEDRAAFDRDGFVIKRRFLPDDAFARLRDEVQAYRGPIREKAEGRTVLRKVTIGSKLLDQLPSLKQVCGSETWQGLIRYVGSRDSEPSMFLQAVLQQASDGEDDPQTVLHADTFHPTVKAWLFLTDVEEDSGPFTYVRGSHRLTPQRLEWERRMSLTAVSSADFETRQGSFRISEAELEDLGFQMPIPIAVPANTLVVADTFGFHARGRSARPSTRVEVWGIGQRNPFLPWTSLDRAVGALSSIGRTGNDWEVRTGISIFDE
ncbi:phytanoyl-CoA dioxygenase family protein [Methylobacterium nodulans]|uniref:Phytanoyl-CoA dioxygenase n=1 Tax=Methylobacterium nodulans (strain LMG 21967 / CNCM I-2342 / ORS 2060) TaxID=460265 RepID=B8IWG2_METNO|nr:phytanoyl-CoA dioxygenase family protein [Methylobacterium nodulans]ACL62752.1 Phytanoyl-CoA dioxygenase [Methylobacterium nodulans ORS 2060]